MYGNSAPVRSRQQGAHPRLEEIVRRHLARPWQAPPHAPTQAALAPLLDALVRARAPIVLDSGCGDGASTLRLAYRHPEAIVVGIDRSAARLERLAPQSLARRGNAWLVRAELAEAWRLLAQSGVRLQRHYLLYPNPWPKSTQLHRRWHGHPVFPWLLALGGTLELRSNWPVYVDEFALALEIAGCAAEAEPIDEDAPPLTPFERKYRDSGHPLWRLTCDVSHATVRG